MIDVSLIIAAVMGITEALKRAGLPSQYAPFAALALGVGANVLFGEGELTGKILEGIILGLSASGLYSGTKAVVKK